MQLNRKFYSTTQAEVPLAVIYVDRSAQYWFRFYSVWCRPTTGRLSTLDYIVPDTLALLVTGPLIAIDNPRNGEIA